MVQNMNDILHKLCMRRWVLRSIIPSIYFNFKYLPLKRAIFLPIFLYSPNLLIAQAKYMGMKPNMIQLGKMMVSIYPNNGITIENKGLVEFYGRCSIGNNSFISVNKNGRL